MTMKSGTVYIANTSAQTPMAAAHPNTRHPRLRTGVVGVDEVVLM